MKILKFITSFICHTLLIPIFLLLTLSLTWYVLPAFQTTFLGAWILNIFSAPEIFIVTLCLIGSAIIFSILGKILSVIRNSKIKNFYTHLLTWLIAIVLVVEALFTFFMSGTLQTVAIELNLFRKIVIGVGVLAMFLHRILYKKLGKLIDRKIQAYDTAKELNANGRSSVVWVQILKTIDFIFPEIILLSTLCFAVSFEVSLYFIFILTSFIIPIIGNIICDKRVKKEAIRKEEEAREAIVNETAEAVVGLLNSQQKGGNP